MDNFERKVSTRRERECADENSALDDAIQKAETYKRQGNDEGYKVWSMIAKFLRDMQTEIKKRRH